MPQNKINLAWTVESVQELDAKQFLAGRELAENEVIVRYMTNETILRVDWENSSWTKTAYKFLKFSTDPSTVDKSRINNGIPVLTDHDSYSVDSIIGRVADADSEFMLLRLDSGSESGSENLRKIKDGFWNNVSVGTMILEEEEIGTMSDSDGNDWPVFEIKKHTPYELSFVVVPALQQANVVSMSEFEKNFKNGLQKQIEPVILEEEKEEQTIMPQTNEIDLATAKLEAAQQEQNRQKTIRSYAEQLRFDNKEVLENLLSNTEISVESAKLAMFEELRRSEAAILPNHSPAIETELQSNKKVESLQSAIGDRLLTGRNDGELKYHSFTELLLGFLQVNDVKLFSNARGNEYDILKLAMSIRKEQLSHATGDFPNLLQSSTNRALEASLNRANVTYTEVSKGEELKDLKQKTFIGTDLIGNLVRREENGQFRRTTLTEGAKSYKPLGYAEELCISEEMLINDDLAAFADLLMQYSDAVQRTRNNVLYGKLSGATFPAGRSGNYTSDLTGLAAMRTAFRKYTITTGDNKSVKLSPSLDIVLCPEAILMALSAVISGVIVPTATSGVNTFQLVNGPTRLIADPELDDASTSNYYGLQSPQRGRPALRHVTYAGAPNGRITQYLEEETRSLVFQVQDWFDAGVNSTDTIIKSTN